MKPMILLYNGVSATYADTDVSPSFSLMALSAYLKSKGYDCKLLSNSCPDQELRVLLSHCRAVGFSVYTGTGIMRSLLMARRVRKLNPSVPIVFGGYHPTLEPDQTIRHPLVDYVMRGEGEQTFYELLNVLTGQTPSGLRAIAGLTYRQNGTIIHNPARTATDINEYPMPDYQLYDNFFQNQKAIPYIASRGCPFDCRFCCSSTINKLHGRRFMRLKTEKIIEHLKAIVQLYNPAEIEFIDDNFLLTPPLISEFVAAYRAGRFSFKWSAFGRCDTFAGLDDKSITDLRDIGLRKIFFGVESASDRILKYISKRETTSDIKKALAGIFRHGIEADCTFINGFPSEEYDDVKKSLELRRYIKKNSPKSTVRFFVFTPLPQTALFRECVEKHGLKQPATLEEWIDYEYRTFRPPWMSIPYRNMINAISWTSFFDTFQKSGDESALRNMVYNLIIRAARFRLQTGWLAFAPEFWLINAIFKEKSRSYLI